MNSRSTSSSIQARATRVAAVGIGMLAVVAATLQHSQSAFSGTTTQGGGAQTAATVKLESGAKQDFAVAGLIPGDTLTRCVDVTYTGDATGDRLQSMRLYSTGDGGSLADYLTVRGAMGGVGSTCANPGSLTNAMTDMEIDKFVKTHPEYDKGIDLGWTPAKTGETRAFQFVFTLPESTPNDAQGLTARPSVTWEIRSAAGTAR